MPKKAFRVTIDGRFYPGTACREWVVGNTFKTKGNHPLLNRHGMNPRFPIIFSLFFLFPSFSAFSGEYDGSGPLLCTVNRIIEVNTLKIIDNIDPDTIGLPGKFIIDFKKNVIFPTKDNVVRRKIAIERMEHVENKLILQGAEEGTANDGIGWSMSISKESGEIVLTASGKRVAYVVFGACVSAGE